MSMSDGALPSGNCGSIPAGWWSFRCSLGVHVMAPSYAAQEINLLGRVVLLALALSGDLPSDNLASCWLIHLSFRSLTSVFGGRDPSDNAIIRRAGFDLSGVRIPGSLVLFYVVIKSSLAIQPASTLFGAFVYTPIAVLMVGGLRRIANIIDRL